MTTLTFMAVHAHPDDEASSTGGLLRLLVNQGVRTVLVTCTNGECGDAPDGAKPSADHHDGDVVAAVRRVELDHAVQILGVDRFVQLGYRDSGMMGWPQNEDPASFWRADVDEAAERLAALMREERPQVVMTYNEIGFYGHPDHIQAHRITMAALPKLDYQPTVYFNAIPSSVMEEWRQRWRAEAEAERETARARGEVVEEAEDVEMDLGTPDDEIDVAVDIRSVTSEKFDALAAHESQIADSFWMKMGRENFEREMTTEWFVRATNPRDISGPSTDIFVGYR